MTDKQQQLLESFKKCVNHEESEQPIIEIQDNIKLEFGNKVFYLSKGTRIPNASNDYLSKYCYLLVMLDKYKIPSDVLKEYLEG